MNDTVNVYDIQGSGYDMAAHELGETGPHLPLSSMES